METQATQENQSGPGDEMQAPPSASAAERLIPVAVGAVCLALGIALGWTVSHLSAPRSRAPSEADMERLCAVNPGVRARAWTHIVLHHSADAVGDAAAFDKDHRRRRGWKRGLGYDFVIGNGTLSDDGQVEVGDRWRRQIDGAHCLAGGMNRKAVGICFVGNFETGRGPSHRQLLSGMALIRHLAERFSIPPENVLGHGQVEGSNTACPGENFQINLFRAAASSP
jgi:hypothetical protein